MLWAVLFIGVFVLSLIGLYFLIHCVQKFRFVSVLSHGKKAVSRLIGVAVILLPSALIGVVWGYINAIIVLLHLAVFWSIAELIQHIVQKHRKQSFRHYYAGIVAIITAVIYLSVGFIQANHVWQTNYTLNTSKNVGTLRVAMLADSHVGTTFDGEGLSAYIAQIQEQKPDVVVIVGDFVDEGTDKENMVAACSALSQLDTPYGVYFVFGNHDKGKYSDGRRGYSGDDLIAEFEKNGVTVLQDEAVLIDNRFYIVGRQDASEEFDFGGSRSDIADLTNGLDKDKYTIVLDHQPRDYDSESNTCADLVLSGHTHGGQLIPLMQLTTWFHIVNDNVYGPQHIKDTDFIVTSGISDWAIQFKTGCRSEYVIIDIQGK